ncbi:MAG TPA: SusD/RagB family nutrient-binding outer membrane lipoprotein [Gemmatimonadales bacterium]|nr:SusD/RagB family nutrient-binding outer membrane lipoprotein [Gemmatimonadales bacterium]
MRTSSQLLFVGALLAFGSAACGDFLSGPGLTTDPNAPSNATRDQRLAAVEATMTVQLTGDLARSACMWMQQCAGVDRQYAGRELYNTTSTDFDTFFIAVYTGGGLIDIRAIEADAAAAGDSVYVGVGKVLEAIDVGLAADLWGDIPYSDAVGANPTPRYDTQQAVYAALLTVLDQAISELAGPGSGPGQVDLWYFGDKPSWTELAHTLKARIYLHLAQRNGTAAYASALSEAKLGLSTAAHNLRTFASAATTENNLWYQFQIIQRDTYLRMGAELVDSIMNKRSDPRLANYFSPISASGPPVYHGAKPGDSFNPAVQSNLSAARLDPAFHQPIATHAEVQLIIAEAAYQTGDATQALDSLNAERTGAGLPTIAAAGAALLDSIMIEKYVVMFQNIETWNDLKRECIPALVPASSVAGGHVISRPLYGATEESANPNAPPDPASGRNWNDPRTATDPCP